MLRYTSECLIKMNNVLKNSAVTFTKKRSLTLKIKLKTRSAIIYEGSNLIDNEAIVLNNLVDFSHSYKTWTIFETSIKYPGVYQVFDQFFGAFSLVLN